MSLIGKPMRPFRPRETLTTRRLNQIQSRLNPLSQMSMTGPAMGNATMNQTLTGTSFNTQMRHIIAAAPASTMSGVVGLPVVITGNASLIIRGTTFVARWKYSWSEIEFLSLQESYRHNWQGTRVKPGGLTGTTDGNDYALNTNEMHHANEPGSSVEWSLSGINAHGADYPDGFAVRPIGGSGTSNDHKVDYEVFLFQMPLSNGKIQWMFTERNSHDGVC